MTWSSITEPVARSVVPLALIVWQPFQAWSTTAKGLLLMGSLCASLASGGFVVGLWSADRIGYGARISALEEWRDVHQEEVVEPEVARIRDLEDRIERVDHWINGEAEVQSQMIYELYCEAFPDRCEAVPR